jgi:hypothetical protein
MAARNSEDRPMMKRGKATKRDACVMVAGVVVGAIIWALGADLLSSKPPPPTTEIMTACQFEGAVLTCREIEK